MKCFRYTRTPLAIAVREKRRVCRASLPVLTVVVFLVAGCAPSVHDYIARGNVAEVTRLLDKDPALLESRDGKLKTPLHKAVTYKHLDIMELLVQRGADSNVGDVTGMTPLHVAAMLGRLEEAAWLLDNGADPALADEYGDLPIHTAAVFGHGQIIGLFVRRGMDLDLPNRNGQTPETIAREYRHERVVSYIAHLRQRSGQAP